ncbi:MAG TPA: lytic murein transglycosylase B [Pseudomonadales bacterium]|nr:lytic murein transglycosylase B [Pseudomonadales bacterium]
MNYFATPLFKKIRIAFTAILTTLSANLLPSLAHADYTQHPAYKAFAEQLEKQDGFSRAQLNSLFATANRQDKILEAISRPIEQTKQWADYKKIFLTQARIDGGVQFWKQNAAVIQRASQQYGVEPEIIVAIIGVETQYGKNKGSWRVLDALATLAFDYPKRSKFFTEELRQFLLMAREDNVDPAKAVGSYAGAMGYGQFMPSSYRSYAVDFDGDHVVDIMNNTTDAIGSVANYFNKHGWIKGDAVISPIIFARGTALNSPEIDQLWAKELKPVTTLGEFAKMGLNSGNGLPAQEKVSTLRLLGDEGFEYWFTLNNFFVISKYNRSPLYCMAVYQLSQAIRQAYSRQ